MKKISIPIIRNKVLVKFPRNCVCCGGRAETSKVLHFSKKIVLSSIWLGDEEIELDTKTYFTDFKIPYCIKHAKSSRILDNIQTVCFLVFSIIFGGGILYFLIKIISLSSIREWVGGVLFSIMMGMLLGYILICLLSLFLFIAIRNFPFSIMSTNSSLGINVKLSPDRTSLIFSFTNKKIAKKFEMLNKVMDILLHRFNDV